MNNKSKLLNLRNVAYNRLPDGTPKEIWVTEGPDVLTAKPKNSPYDFEIYQSIQRAIEEGIINIGTVDSDCCSKGIFDNDEDAIANGLVIGDVYELSATNTLDPNFAALLKVVRSNVVIAQGNGLGLDQPNSVLGTGLVDANNRPIILGIN
jgi:hypothetical protein